MKVNHAQPISMIYYSKLSYCFSNYNIKAFNMQDKTIRLEKVTVTPVLMQAEGW